MAFRNILKLGFTKCQTNSILNDFLAEFDVGNQCIFTGVKPIDTLWHHALFVANNGDNLLYLDGQLRGQINLPLQFAVDDFWSIGQDYDTGLKPTDHFKGQMDEIMIWNKALTPIEVDRWLRYSH